MTDPLGNTVSYGYSSALNKMYSLPSTLTDPKGVITNAAYDTLGRTTGTTITGTADVDYIYSSGNLSQIVRTNSSNAAQTYNLTYNVFGNLTALKVGTRSLAGYTYDSLDRLIYFYHPSTGVRVKYTYDSNNRLTKTDYLVDGWSSTYEQYTYNTSSNPTSYFNGSIYTMSWIEGRRLSTLTTGGKATNYQYNADGLRVRKNNSDGNECGGESVQVSGILLRRRIGLLLLWQQVLRS